MSFLLWLSSPLLLVTVSSCSHISGRVLVSTYEKTQTYLLLRSCDGGGVFVPLVRDKTVDLDVCKK